MTLRIPLTELQQRDRKSPGLLNKIILLEHKPRPDCPHCGSGDTAKLYVGSLNDRYRPYLASITTRLKLRPNDVRGGYWCYRCSRGFTKEAS